MKINQYLQYMVEKSASDLFFSAGFPVLIKIKGNCKPINKNQFLSTQDAKELAYSVMNDRYIRTFEERWEVNIGVSVENLGRFRVNIFRQRGSVSMVIRNIKTDPPTIAELNLPDYIGQLALEKRGLILVAGATGSGKSSTMAAMLNYRNEMTSGHILTIEDPIEYLHSYKQSIVNQREVETDTKSYAEALKNAMREAPDVILIGEIRDTDTMRQAIIYSETGHLCLATIHASNAVETLDRAINFFPESNRKQLLMDLGRNLKAILCQRLLKSCDGNLVPALEILKQSPYLSELILKDRLDDLGEALERSLEEDMITFDRSIMQLYQNGEISEEEAITNADSKHNVAVEIRLAHEGGMNVNSWHIDDE